MLGTRAGAFFRYARRNLAHWIPVWRYRHFYVYTIYLVLIRMRSASLYFLVSMERNDAESKRERRSDLPDPEGERAIKGKVGGGGTRKPDGSSASGEKKWG